MKAFRQPVTLFQGAVRKRALSSRGWEKGSFVGKAAVWKRGTTPSFQRGVSLSGKADSSVPPQEPRQHSGHEPEHGNEGKGMAQARRVGDEADDRRAEQEAEEPDG